MVTAYDYYPFGMLMPGRYLTDTASRCALITQAVMMPKWTTVPININQTNLLPLAGGALTFSTAKVTLSASAPGSGFYQTHTVQPGLQQSVAIKTGYVTSAQMVALVTEVVGSDTILLASGGIERDGLLTLAFTPSQSSVLLKVVHNGGFGMAGTMEVTLISKDELSWEPKNTLLSVCNSELGRYRFGFNGQQKTNEIAGVGNHNTALFWEYDTRIGRRWNLDPITKISISDYSVLIGNPIKYYDVNGDDTGKVYISEKKWRNVYRTHMKGIAKNPGLVNPNGHIYLNYDPVRSNARSRRARALRGVQNPTPQTHDIDEFPYASTKEGGENAATNVVPKSENRQHGGYLGAVVKKYKMKEGDVFDIVLIPDKPPRENQPQPQLVPSESVRPMRPVGGYPGQGIGNLISDIINWISGENIRVPDPVPMRVPAPVPAPTPVPAQ